MWLVPPLTVQPVWVALRRMHLLAPASGVGLQQHAVCSSTSAVLCCSLCAPWWSRWPPGQGVGAAKQQGGWCGAVLRCAAVQVIPQRPVAVGGVSWLHSSSWSHLSGHVPSVSISGVSHFSIM
jgi:hypothetical protein